MDPHNATTFAGLPDLELMSRITTRFLVAALLGGLVGYERMRDNKSAGIRTHCLVALGAAMFTFVPLEFGMSPGDMGRVVQGVATGIGFLGAGTILHFTEQHRIEGLTTAAGIWLTAAAGMTVGAGWFCTAAFGVILAWAILFFGQSVERRLHPTSPPPSSDKPA
jgi:putative Mg2+ transporter-C (MgtC) family protein